MNPGQFRELHESLLKNIEEIKTTIKKLDHNNLNLPEVIKKIERTKYLFYGLTKSLLDIGNNIIIENDFREPINNADIFVSLAEHEIIIFSIVPGVKKAILGMPYIGGRTYSELLQLISESIVDLHKCLDFFALYFGIKGNQF